MRTVATMATMASTTAATAATATIATMAAAGFCVPAHAHVKWFVEHDVKEAPLAIAQVLSGSFITFLLISVALVYGFFLVDRLLYRKRVLADFEQRLRSFDEFSVFIMRISAAIFFVALFLWDLKVGVSFFLTPELKTALPFVPYLHLAMGLCALLPAAAPLTGAGIFVFTTPTRTFAT